MIYKARSKSDELIILENLKKRMNLSSEEKLHYTNLKKGYEGEQLFDRLVEKEKWNGLILNDLCLEVNNTTFQIDSLFLLQNSAYLFEIKYLDGDYYYEADKLYKKPNIEVINPLHQLSRSESLLRKLLLQLGYNLTIHAAVVFIHPTFTLYQAPLNKAFIFPTQINGFLTKLSTMPSQRTERTTNLAEQLVNLHKIDTRFSKLPKYSYEQLRKGVVCCNCASFSGTVGLTKYTCSNCKYTEPISETVLRSVKEFQLLFPNEKITTRKIHDWCQIIPSTRTISRILSNHYTVVGKRRWTYYK